MSESLPLRDVAIVVPSHTPSLTRDERISLAHLERHLGAYDRYLAVPRSYAEGPPGFELKRFPDRYFATKLAHQAMMLSQGFYRAFSEYRYILVYHLDCLVFADELLEWCRRDYDYIGAPWFDVKFVERPTVGNGGFSLRKIEAFLDVLSSRRLWLDPYDYWARYWAEKPWSIRLFNLPRRWLKRSVTFNGVRWETRRWLRGTNTSRAYGPHEDIFWSFVATHYSPDFRIAPVDEALRFSFEVHPRRCFELNRRRLPFGCHAWPLYDRRFWEPHLLADSLATAEP